MTNEGDGSLVEQAMRSVTCYIYSHNMRAGDTLPSENFFIDYLNVSRTVMREAFRSLAALRVIDVGNGRKPRVCRMDSSVMATSLYHGLGTSQISVAEIWEVRRAIETKTAMLAAKLRTDDEASHILEVCKAMAASTEDFAMLIACDVEFHQAVARASRNTFFEHLVGSFEPLTELVASAAWKTRTTKVQKSSIVKIHHAVAKAILQKDSEGAARAMDLHFDYAVDVLHRVAPIPSDMVGDAIRLAPR